jgi:hypothetical protein
VEHRAHRVAVGPECIPVFTKVATQLKIQFIARIHVKAWLTHRVVAMRAQLARHRKMVVHWHFIAIADRRWRNMLAHMTSFRECVSSGKVVAVAGGRWTAVDHFHHITCVTIRSI